MKASKLKSAAMLMMLLGAGAFSVSGNAQDAEKMYMVTERANLRKTASVEGDWIMAIPEGAVVERIGGEKDGYTLVSYDGVKGFVTSEHLCVPGEENKAVQTVEEDSTVITAKEVHEMAVNGMEKRQQQAAEIAASVASASEKQAKIYSVVSNVNFRETASAQGVRLGMINAGSSVEILDEGENGFYHVKYEGQEGYVLAKCVDDGSGSAGVSTYKGKVSMQQVAVSGAEGLEGGQTITTTAGQAMATQKKTEADKSKQISYQIGVKTNMRTMPDDDENLLASLPAGTNVLLLGESGDYAMVEYDGMVGYVMGDDLMDSVEYARMSGDAILFTLTGYCSCPICCGQYSPAITGGVAHTATGTVPEQGRTIAVDPRVIPYGTHVTIEGMGTYTAEDCGGGVKNNHIDVYFENHQDAIIFGRQQRYVVIQ